MDYTTKCLPGMNHKECYALHRHLLHGYWQRGPLRQPSIRMTLHQSPLREGGAEITQDSPCDVASCGQVLAYINFPIHRIHRSFVRHKVRPYSLYARMRFCELTERITHGLLVDTFSSKGKHICALSKHHAVKMAYMDKWRSAPSILVPNAA